MRHICLYIGVQIFIARAGAGPPEVVQEALADLKMDIASIFHTYCIRTIELHSDVFGAVVVCL